MNCEICSATYVPRADCRRNLAIHPQDWDVAASTLLVFIADCQSIAGPLLVTLLLSPPPLRPPPLHNLLILQGGVRFVFSKNINCGSNVSSLFMVPIARIGSCSSVSEHSAIATMIGSRGSMTPFFALHRRSLHLRFA